MFVQRIGKSTAVPLYCPEGQGLNVIAYNNTVSVIADVAFYLDWAGL